jgi:hypothetical protein
MACLRTCLRARSLFGETYIRIVCFIRCTSPFPQAITGSGNPVGASSAEATAAVAATATAEKWPSSPQESSVGRPSCCVSFAGGSLVATLREVQPTLFVGVPHVWYEDTQPGNP